MQLATPPLTTRAPRQVSSRVLVIQADPPRARRLSQVVRCLSRNVDVVPGLDEANGLDPQPYELVIADADALTFEQRQHLSDALARTDAQPRVLLFSSARSREDLLALFGTTSPVNWVARTPEDDLTDFIVTVQKILKRDVFGIEKYFSWGAEPLELRLSRSSEKAHLLEETERFSSEVAIPTRVGELLLSAADELFSNAIYDAPTREDGQFRHPHRSRREQVVLEEGEEIAVKLICDGKRVGISVEDPFGSLEPKRVQHYLAKCFRGGADQIDEKTGGAGVGLYQVFETLSHVVVNIARGQRTELIGMVDLRPSYREIASRPKSFNVFVSEGLQ